MILIACGKYLKRAGKRGENKWVSIPFEQAVKEICEGGKLFAKVPGEENREVEGLAKLRALTDPKISKEMASDVKAILDEKDKDKKKALVEQFKSKHAANLDKLIDPNHPDLGPKKQSDRGGVGSAQGRTKRLVQAFCRGPRHYQRSRSHHGMSRFSVFHLQGHQRTVRGQENSTDGKKFYWQADTENSRFIFFVGANLFEANYGPPNRAVRLTGNLVSGHTKIAVADPRFSKLASKAWKWLPLKPGTDAALAAGMIRWIIENKRYDAKFLSCANKAAAVAAGENSWCNATWLVEIKDGKPGKLVQSR